METPFPDGEPLAAFRRSSGNDRGLEPASERRMISFLLHEISSPLTVIQGFSELIRDEALSLDEIREYAADISSEASRLITLVVRARQQYP
jgi:signal transduction histidine kinase